MNWDNAKYFLAIARAGTLRGAAQALGVDQATVGRRLASFEDELGARLFLRTPQLFVLTAAGEGLMAAAEAMEHSANAIERRIAGMDERLAGTIRIATSESLGTCFVLPALARLRQLHPDIDTVCVTSAQVANLTRREADLAVRTVRPDAPDLIARRLGQQALGLYASRAYLRERGEPREGDAFDGHDLLLYQRSMVPSMWEALCGEPIARGRVVFQTSSTTMLVRAVQAGMGIAELPTYLAKREGHVVPVMPRRRDRFDVWMVAHADLFRTARVQALVGLLGEAFAPSGPASSRKDANRRARPATGRA